MSTLPKRYFTQEEFVELENKSEYRSQFVAGEIFAMELAQVEHVVINGNLTALLGNAFRGRSCQAYATELRVRVKASELWTHPDVSALCGPPHWVTSSSPHSLLNPQVIFEILSPTTEGFDRGDKFARYRRLDSLTDYVLVAQDRMRVEHFIRQANGSWNTTEYTAPESVVPLPIVGCELPLAEIYDKVTFPEHPSPP